ncbi:hypothetical protein [Mesoflavibacter zeaxanthinifaciens]|uniref:hypothetical protein n=1 Tax=Mesoflavibacter zeaxanthinifaciens TaxID=393060 RepID=UPI003A8FA31B
MDYNFFGVLNEEGFKKLSEIEKRKHLSSLSFLKTSISLFNGKVALNQHGGFIIKKKLSVANKSYVFKKEIGSEIHEFLLNEYQGYIGADLRLFQMDFVKDNYAINELDLKDKGLKYFNYFFYQCCDKMDQLMSIDSNGEPQLESRFASLNRTRDNFGNLICENKELVFQFLFGKKHYFDTELFKSNDLIKHIIQFENILQILIYLNNRFSFEEDMFFSNRSITAKIFAKYENEIESIKVVEFLESVFSNKFYKERKYGLAMHHCLKKDLNLMKLSANSFKELCNTYFDCNFENLRLGSYSDSHINHVDFFKKEWSKFTS